jgi:hypothetical protein
VLEKGFINGRKKVKKDKISAKGGGVGKIYMRGVTARGVGVWFLDQYINPWECAFSMHLKGTLERNFRH